MKENDQNNSTAGEASHAFGCSDVPSIRIRDVADDFSDFFMKLSNGSIPMPIWLEIGDARHKITKDTHYHLARGMILCLEAREEYAR